MLELILKAILAFFEFWKIIVSKKQVVKEEIAKDKDDLKEEMHRALLAGDNNAIVICLNKYNVLRDQAKKL